MPEFAKRDALGALRYRDALRTACRAWEREWDTYEAQVVKVARDAGIPDAQVAQALGLPRQNLHRRHGKRADA